ncbi:MAG: diguanylate cyclase domain-containing protein [Vulcanimicrobiota bacterium]
MKTQAEQLVKRGINEIENNQLNKAEQLFQEAIKTYPTYAPAYAKLGLILNMGNRNQEAIESYKKAIDYDPNNIEYIIQLGEIYNEESMHAEALELFQAAKDMGYQEPELYWNLGSIYQTMNQDDQAKANFEVLIEMLDKNNQWQEEDRYKSMYWNAHSELGVIHMNRKEWDMAHAYFNRIQEHSDNEIIKKSIKVYYDAVKAERSKRKGTVYAIILLAIISIAMLLFWLLVLKPQQKGPKKHLPYSARDAKDFPQLANFALQHLKILTLMPKSLIYFIEQEGEPLKLYLADELPQDKYNELKVDWDKIYEWANKNADHPFVYEIEKKEAIFQRAFPGVAEYLDSASPRIGVPFITQEGFWGLAFMCYPGLKAGDKKKFKAKFKKNVLEIHKIGREVAASADRIYKRKVAITDMATRAYNQIYMREKLGYEVNKSKDQRKPVSLLMFEVDRLVAIQKRFGEEKKNYVLKTLVQEIKNELGEDVVSIFRIADNRFAITLPGIDSQKGIKIAHNLGLKISQIQFKSPIPGITITAGLVTHPEHVTSQESFESFARESLDEAIQSGRNCLFVEGKKVIPTLCPDQEQLSTKTVKAGAFLGDDEGQTGKETPGIITLDSVPPQAKKPIKMRKQGTETGKLEDILNITPVGVKKKGNRGSEAETQQFDKDQPGSTDKKLNLSGLTGTIRSDKKSGSAFTFRKANKQAPNIAKPDEEQNETKSGLRSVNISRTEEEKPRGDVEEPGKPGIPKWQKPRPSKRSIDTSKLKSPPKLQMRTSKSSTSQLPQLNTTTESKPMSGLIRRSKTSPPSSQQPKRRAGGAEFKRRNETPARQPKTEHLKKMPRQNIPTSQLSLRKIDINLSGRSVPTPQKSGKPGMRTPKSGSFMKRPNQQRMNSIGKALPETPSADAMKMRMIPPGAVDPVTGFYFKSFFEQSIGRLMMRANKNKHPLSLLFFKLDKHKELKTKYGDGSLNNVLKEISTMVNNFLKEGSDIPSRYSDEIFVIILPNTSYQVGFNLAEQIRFTVGNLSFKDIPGHITMSLGIASFPEKGRSPKEVMKNSYDAMVFAIKSGGNKSVIWDEDLLKRKK